MSRPVAIAMLSKPGCHLCDDAREAIERVRGALAEEGIETEFEEANILADPDLARLHAEDIPVVMLNGRRHAIWRVDETRLAAAVQKASRRGALFHR